MKRYVTTTLIGTGTDTDMFRPVVHDYGVTYSTVVSPDHFEGGKKWVLAVVAATEAQFAALNADANIDVLSFGPESLDNTWVSIGTNQERNFAATRLATRTGITIPRDDPRTLREIITQIGQALDSGFNVNNMDVADIT